MRNNKKKNKVTNYSHKKRLKRKRAQMPDCRLFREIIMFNLKIRWI